MNDDIFFTIVELRNTNTPLVASASDDKIKYRNAGGKSFTSCEETFLL